MWKYNSEPEPLTINAEWPKQRLAQRKKSSFSAGLFVWTHNRIVPLRSR
ncbi:MAG: hypothetical protein ACI8QT_002119 [Halioglobus sp.]|jgi:hypothetical protein